MATDCDRNKKNGLFIDARKFALAVELQFHVVRQLDLVSAQIAVDLHDARIGILFGNVRRDLRGNDGGGNLRILALHVVPLAVVAERYLGAVDETHVVIAPSQSVSCLTDDTTLSPKCCLMNCCAFSGNLSKLIVRSSPAKAVADTKAANNAAVANKTIFFHNGHVFRLTELMMQKC